MTTTTEVDAGWVDVFAELRSAVRDVCAVRDAEAARARVRHCDTVAVEAGRFWLDTITGRNSGAPVLGWVGYTDPITCGKNSMAVAAIGAGVFACYHAPGGTRSPWLSLIAPCPCGVWAETDVGSLRALLAVLDQVADRAFLESCHNLAEHRRLRAGVSDAW